MKSFIFSLSTHNVTISYTVGRVAIGTFFFFTGFNKLVDPQFQESMLKTISGIGLPFPQFSANAVAFSELLFGLLLALGLFTRFAAFILNIILFVALFTVDLSKIPGGLDPVTWYTYFLYLPQILYVLFIFLFIQSGGGKWSLDNLIFRKS